MKTLTDIVKEAQVYVRPYPYFQLAGLAKRDLEAAGYLEHQIVELMCGKVLLRFKNENTYAFEDVEAIEKNFIWSDVYRPAEDYEFRMYHAPLTKDDLTENGKYSLD